MSEPLLKAVTAAQNWKYLAVCCQLVFMTANSSAKPVDTDSNEAVLASCIDAAASLLAAVKEKKQCVGACAWAFAMFARIANAGHSVTILLSADCTIDAKLVVRSMYDGMLDVGLLLGDPGREDEFIDMLDREAAVDQYETLQFYSKAKRVSLQKLEQTVPIFASIISDYRHAKSHKSFKQPARRADRKHWPRRWAKITRQEKLTAIEKSGFLANIGFTAQTLGDAVAHHRYSVLQHFMRIENDAVHYDITPDFRPSDELLFSRDWIAFEAAGCILLCLKILVEKYHLHTDMEVHLVTLISRINSIGNK